MAHQLDPEQVFLKGEFAKNRRKDGQLEYTVCLLGFDYAITHQDTMLTIGPDDLQFLINLKDPVKLRKYLLVCAWNKYIKPYASTMEELKFTMADVLEKGSFTVAHNSSGEKIFTVHLIGVGDPKLFPRKILRESELPKYWKKNDVLDLAYNKYKLKI